MSVLAVTLGVGPFFNGRNMGNKNPAFQFYPGDWTRDLNEHPLEIGGAWIQIICSLWWSPEQGRSTKTIDQWARILGVQSPDAMNLIEYICNAKIGDVTVRNNLVTVTNRRMYGEHKEKENTRLRVRRHREKRIGNANVTLPSSSSSSSSKKEPRAAHPEQVGNERFDQFWTIYPRHKGKINARKALDKALRDGGNGLLDTILEAVEKLSQTDQWIKDGGQFIPYPATWLNSGGWDDEAPVNDADERAERRYRDMTGITKRSEAERAEAASPDEAHAEMQKFLKRRRTKPSPTM